MKTHQEVKKILNDISSLSNMLMSQLNEANTNEFLADLIDLISEHKKLRDLDLEISPWKMIFQEKITTLEKSKDTISLYIKKSEPKSAHPVQREMLMNSIRTYLEPHKFSDQYEKAFNAARDQIKNNSSKEEELLERLKQTEMENGLLKERCDDLSRALRNINKPGAKENPKEQSHAPAKFF